jgi:hypothetical protein
MASESVTVLPLSDAANLLPGAGVDDTLFTPSSHGEILVTDRTGSIFLLRGSGVNSNLVLSAAQDAGELGSLNTSTGLFTPIVSGLGSPRGLAFIDAGPFADLSNYTLVDPSTDPVGPFDPATGFSLDPNLTNDTTHNVLLTEKYDDLKVQAILNEIAGLPSHTFFGSDKSQIPAIFGMNFQAVSVAEKDANGGITLLSNGQEGPPSTLLEGAIEHTDDSIGQITAALKAAGIWDSTLVVLAAKYGQAPRVGLGGLMSAGTLSTQLSNAGINVAQATEDDVSLLWLQNQSQTFDAVKALQNFKATGMIQVTFAGVTQTLPASQIIKQIIADTPNADASLGSFKLGNPATDSTTPDIVVTLQPGYIWVGNVLNKHKRGEHGGFSDDDTHVALILGGGAIRSKFQGTTQTGQVETVQIAVTALDALGLNPNDLTGVQKEHTKALPGSGIPLFHSESHRSAEGDDSQFTKGKGRHNDADSTLSAGDLNAQQELIAMINWGDVTQSGGLNLLVTPNKHEIVGDRTNHTEGVNVVSTHLTDSKNGTGAISGFQNTVATAKNEMEALLQDQIDDGFWSKFASLGH